MPFSDVTLIDPYVQKGLASDFQLTLALSDEVDDLEAERRGSSAGV
jgi:hypothetical protein